MVSPPADAKEEAKEPISAADLVLQRLQDVLADATDRGAQQMKFDRGFVEAIVNAMATKKADYVEARKQIDSMKRASKQYIDGISVAQTEYDRELKARRDAEAEVTRLRVLLSGQAARLTALTGDSRRQELRQQMSKELHENLNGLERDLSKLKVERDVTLAEVEELNAVSSISGVTSEPPANLSRSLTKRLDNLKSQYQRDLVPLTQQREALTREVMELKAARDVFLEETTVLNARNEELAQLSAQYSRRAAMAPPNAPSNSNGTETPSKNIGPMIVETPVRIDSRNIQQQQTPQQTHQLSAYSSVEEFDARKTKVEETHTPSRGPVKVFKWGSRAKEVSAPIAQSVTEKVKIGHMEHSFQPLSLLRFTRCDHCGEKMWGSQLRCMGCSISVHTRCVNQVHSACSPQTHNSNGGGNNEDSQLLPPSMFGRDLIEQVLADAKGGSRKVPVIVEKCIEAVEKLAMDYEGIYRKTGGSGQSRIITQLFERGDYQAFDLLDSDRFNDICSVTSVLKTYLRSLPVPLLTHDLHDQFMSAVEIRDPALKNSTLTELVNNLPPEHYHTVRMLMLHLNRICQLSEVNLMNARNLGVVFGPTLMRSRNPGAEFSDMAGKALSIEWLVESAPQVFNTPTDL
ncbi:Rho GTPase activation protein [Lentinula edodes]|nr:Rho GTPase activation protein [Lentinula edodes]